MVKRVRKVPPANNPEKTSGSAEEISEPNINTDKASELPKSADSGGFNPLAENVTKRDYSSVKIDEAKVGEVVEEIAAPRYIDPTELSKADEDSAEAPPSPLDHPNDAINDLSAKDQKQAAEMVVDMVLDAYEQLHVLGKKYVQFSDMEMAKMSIEQGIDMAMIVPIDDNQAVPLREFINQYNEQATVPLSYDEEFGEKVRPAMIRVAMKQGWGVSDEQFLIYMFGKDLTVKVGSAISLRKQMKETIYLITESAKTATPERSAAMADQAAAAAPRPERNPETEFTAVDQEEVSDEELEEEETQAEKNPSHGNSFGRKGFDVHKNFGGNNPLSTKSKRKPPAPRVRTEQTTTG
tara:strand:- start:7850 stop:8905 length:1056 start_codon:yes stop_codon:yes gene_type:complete